LIYTFSFSEKQGQELIILKNFTTAAVFSECRHWF